MQKIKIDNSVLFLLIMVSVLTFNYLQSLPMEINNNVFLKTDFGCLETETSKDISQAKINLVNQIRVKQGLEKMEYCNG